MDDTTSRYLDTLFELMADDRDGLVGLCEQLGVAKPAHNARLATIRTKIRAHVASAGLPPSLRAPVPA